LGGNEPRRANGSVARADGRRRPNGCGTGDRVIGSARPAGRMGVALAHTTLSRDRSGRAEGAQRTGAGRIPGGNGAGPVTERRDDRGAAEGGLARRSLRDLASQVGTSHRMLIHHFGSRDGLMAAVVESVERDQNERLGELPEDAAEAIRSTWKRTSVPSLWPI